MLLHNIRVVWNSYSKIYDVVKPSDGGAWEVPLSISDSTSPAGNPLLGDPWLSADGLGNAYIVWSSEFHPLNTPQALCR